MKKNFSCLLCKKEKSNVIHLFSERAQKLNCVAIIEKHFWIKPNEDAYPKQRICLVCWRNVRDFHQFYELVAQVHNYIECKKAGSKSNIVAAEIDPLPTISTTTEPTVTNLNDKAIKSEIELHDFDWVKVKDENVEETIETSSRAMRASRRNRLKQKPSTTKKAATKKQLESKTETCDGIEDDETEIEMPLSVLLEEVSSKAEEEPKMEMVTENEAFETFNLKSESVFEEVCTEESIIEPAMKSPSITSLNEQHHAFSETDGSSDAEDAQPERCAQLDAKFLKGNKNRKRKRIRPKEPSYRMTKAEIEAIKLQQIEYDEIIAKFFDNFPCPHCKLVVGSMGEMRQHFKEKHHNEKTPFVKCCGLSFHTRKNLAEHVLFHENPERFKCSECQQCFKNSYTLRKHEKSHAMNDGNANGDRTFECHICSKKLSSKVSVQEHLALKHTPETEFAFPCADCDKRFPTRSTLNKHKYSKHRAESLAFMCDQCGKSLNSHTALKYHIKNEHSDISERPEKPRVECEFCGVKLASVYTLKLHFMSFHEKQETEHRCQICGYLSSNARALKRHIEYNHKTEKKHACTYCDKAFKKKETLREHITTHTGEGRYTCPDCSMTFACKANYFKHKQRRHGHKPVQRNLIGLAEKKLQKLKANANKAEVEQLLCDVGVDMNVQSLAASI